MKLFLSFDFDTLKPVSHWRATLWQLAACIIVLMLVYYETVASITSIWWRSDTFAHGMLIIPFSLFMIWTKRETLAQLTPKYCWFGAIIFLLSIAVWLLGWAANTLAIQQLALLFMVWSIVFIIIGTQAVRHILFPLAFMFFAIPLGEGLIPVLMDITAYLSVKALTITGFPVYREGMLFSIPSGSFEVAKACSGVRYLFASVALGSLFAYINYQSFWKRTVFICISVILPIIANGIRAYGIVLIAHYSDRKYAIGVDHLIYGWLFFGLVMFILFFLGSLWREEHKTTPVETMKSAPEAVKVKKNILFAVLLLISLGPAGQYWVSLNSERTVGGGFSMPDKIGDWNKLDYFSYASWEPKFHGASAEYKVAYKNGEKTISLYMAYYLKEEQNAELINQNNIFYRQDKWKEIERTKETVVSGNGSKINLQQYLLKMGATERVLWFWYDINGNATPNAYIAKLLQGGYRIWGNDRGGAVITLVENNIERSQQKAAHLEEFLAVAYLPIQKALSKVRGLQ